MKHIKAVIRPEKLGDVRDALDIAGCSGGVMVSEIMGHGNQKGIMQAWRGEKYQVDLLPKIMLDLVLRDEDLETVKKIIIDNARCGDIGDGKIFVYNVESVTRIRTGEEGDDAI